ncbi:hypothetical protein [Psychrobacter sp. I-STPA6b]|uniref:hypothetical protein n=1 Tax=Psychrobacter sp. I-STPA6b TaxID=2585718 RepID=UPI001D0C8EB9|nr:hypothetical protein [Psychrobacter sp. I-STPA6b]
MQLQKYIFATWECKKQFTTPLSKRDDRFIEELVSILKLLKETDFFHPTEVQLWLNKTHKIDENSDEYLTPDYWQPVLSGLLNEIAVLEVIGKTKIINNVGESVYTENSIKIEFMGYPFEPEANDIDILIIVNDDVFLPYFVVETVKKNPYYEVNSENLANVLTKIQKLGYEVSDYKDGNAVAVIDGFYVKERRCSDGEIVEYDVRGYVA